jgi:AI-2E family transporter
MILSALNGSNDPSFRLDLNQALRRKAAKIVDDYWQHRACSLRTIRQLLSGEDEIQLTIRLALLALLIYWSFVVIRPFVPILAWSVVLTVALYPVFNWLSRLLGNRPKLAAIILTAINLGIVIGPATWLGLSAVEGVRSFAAQLGSGTLVIPSPPAAVKDWPVIGGKLYGLWDQASTNLRALLGEAAPQLKPVAGTILGLAGDAGMGALKFLVAVVLAGLLFPAGPRLVAGGRSFLSRVVAERSENFLVLAGATIRSVSQGVIGIAVFQSLLAGIALKLADVRGADAGNPADRVRDHPYSRLDLALVGQGFYDRVAYDPVPGARRARRQCAETHCDGTRSDHSGARHLHWCDRRNAGAWDGRPLYWADHPGGGVGVDDGMDTRRSGNACTGR